MTARAAPAPAPALSIFLPWLVRWELAADGEPFRSRLGAAFLPVRRDGAAAMLKLVSEEEERRGARTLAWFEGQGAVEVFAAEGEALLMERAIGHQSLSAWARSGQDDAACRVLCQVAEALHAPRPRAAPLEAVALDAWFGALWPAAEAQGGAFALAAQAARGLLASPREVRVLHGDLHHDNVLDGGERGWLAIDAKGLVGERGFEFANLFRNPDIDVALEPGRMARRLAIVSAAADLEPRRLVGWICAYAGLGAAWSASAGADPRPGLSLVEAAAALL